jgi:hypothetical protein
MMASRQTTMTFPQVYKYDVYEGCRSRMIDIIDDESSITVEATLKTRPPEEPMPLAETNDAGDAATDPSMQQRGIIYCLVEMTFFEA